MESGRNPSQINLQENINFVRTFNENSIEDCAHMIDEMKNSTDDEKSL
jgi:hypothetical protein